MRIVAAVTESTRKRCFSPETWAKLKALGEFQSIDDAPLRRTDDLKSFAGKVKDAQVLVTAWGTPRITPAVLDACRDLKLIAHGAGSVAFVDIEAWRRNITVTNVMPIMAMGVAEFTVTCILSGLRRMDALVQPGRWDTLPFYTVPKVGFMLRDKIVGLVGLGIIGRQTLELLRPFGCKFMVYDPYLSHDAIAEAGIESVDLDTLMKSADVVSLHAPGTPATKNVINLERLNMLKPGAVLVNTARGILIDHDALATVAARGEIGVYLDVTTPEPLPEDHRLRKQPNVILTPHIAGPTVEGWPRMGEACVEDVARFVRGEKVKFAVTEQQYANQSTS